MTKQEYYANNSNQKIQQNLDKVYELLEYTANCYYLLAFAISRLTGCKLPVYYIRELLQYSRIWVILEELNQVYYMDRLDFTQFIFDNYEELEKKCLKEFRNFGFEPIFAVCDKSEYFESVYYELESLSLRKLSIVEKSTTDDCSL